MSQLPRVRVRDLTGSSIEIADNAYKSRERVIMRPLSHQKRVICRVHPVPIGYNGVVHF